MISFLNLKKNRFDCIIAEKKPPSSWPSNGKILFDAMSLRYSETDQPVLKNINCSIEAKEKVL